MYSTPSRRIRVYADQENGISMVPKSVGRGNGSRTACRTPLSDLNGQRPLSRQHLKDSMIKEERSETPKCSLLQRCGHDSASVKQTSPDADVRDAGLVNWPEESSVKKEIGGAASAIPDCSTRPVPSPLSFTQVAALMSPSVPPIDEESSSVVPLTLYDPRGSPCDADVSLLADEIVGDAIRNAKRVVLLGARNDEGHSFPAGESSSAVNPSRPRNTKILTLRSPSSDVANISIGDISPVHRIGNHFYGSPISEGFSDFCCTLADNDKQTVRTYEDSGLSINSFEEMESTEEISLDSFLSSRDDSVVGERSENLFLTLTPSKILQNAPKLVIPFPRIASALKSEYEVAQSVRNLWKGHDSEVGGNIVVTSEASTHMTPCKSQECGTSPIDTTDQTTSPMPVSLTDAAVAMTPVRLSSKETETDHQKFRDFGVGEGVATTLEMSTYMTPCKSQECGTSPVATSNQLSLPMQVSSVDAGTLMSPTILLSKETETEQQALKDAGVGDGVATTLEMSTYMTPCKSQECGTSPIATSDQLTSPMWVSSVDSGTAMSPVILSSKETETVQQTLRDASVGDSVATTFDMSTSMTPLKSQECGTSPIATSNQLTSPMPVSSTDAETAITPVHYVSRETETSPAVASSVDAETCTTPITVSPVRLSSFSRTSEDSVALMDQMKSSHVTNKLLRREVSSLKQSHTKWEEHLQREQQEMKRRLSTARHEKVTLQDVRVTAKGGSLSHQESSVEHRLKLPTIVSVQTVCQLVHPSPLSSAVAAAQMEIDNLLAQVGEQLGQIAGLEETLQKKNEEIADLEGQNSERKTKYCGEIKELQDDLCMAYKQHEEEVSRLKGVSEKQSSYERLYLEGVRRNRELGAEIQAYSSLGDIMDRAAKLQKRMPLLQETFTAVKFLVDETQRGKEDIVQQKEGLAAREESLRRESESHSGERSQLVSEMATLREALEEESKKTMFADMDRERLQDELLAEQGEKKILEESLQETRAGIAELTTERAQLQEQVEILTAAGRDGERRREEESGRLSAEVDEMKRRNEELNEERESLSSEIEPLKEELSETLQRVSSTEDELKRMQESKDFVDQERESLEEYTKDLEGRVATLQEDIGEYQAGLLDAANNIQQYEATVQEMRERLFGCQSELELTKQRAHHIIMQQGAQISSASTALADLIGRLEQFSLEVTAGQTKHSMLPVEEGHLSAHQSSFVFAILNSPPPREDDEGSAPSSLEISSLGASMGSAFSRVTPAKPPRPEPERSIAELVQQTNDVINELFDRVTEKIRDRNQTVQELWTKSKDLETDFHKSKRHHGSQLEGVQRELCVSEEHVRQLKQELRLALNRLYDQHERTKMAAGEQEMAQLIRRMQGEVDRLREELHQVRQESQAQQEHIATLTGMISANPDPGQKMALLTQLSADNAQLKRKLRSLEAN